MLIQPARTWRMMRSTWTDTPIPPDEPLAANPPAGAVIEYFLPRAAKHPVTLEILDDAGHLVRRYSSDDPLEPSAEELARELIPRYWIADPRSPPTSPGMHRWVWDMRYPAPVTVTRGYPISAVPHATPRGPEGPLALPGTYQVVLTVDGHKLQAPLTLVEDPRVQIAPTALQDQLHLAAQLADSLSETSRALLTARSEHEQLEAVIASPVPAVQTAVQKFDKQLLALLEAPDDDHGEEPASTLLPDVQSHLETLYVEVTQADAAPTAAQVETWHTAQASAADLLRTWQQLQTELPALNKLLRANKLAQVRPDLPPPRDVNAADEE
jgi:hypothetical protein